MILRGVIKFTHIRDDFVMRTNEKKMQKPSLYVLPVCEVLGFIQLDINTLIFLSFLRCADTRTAAFLAVQMIGLPHGRNNHPATMGHLPGITKTHPARRNPDQSAF